VIKKLKHGLKILGTGELKRKITVKAHVVFRVRKSKIESGGGFERSDQRGEASLGASMKFLEAIARISHPGSAQAAPVCVWRCWRSTVGGHIPTPGIDTHKLESSSSAAPARCSDSWNLFSGRMFRGPWLI